MQTSLFGPEGHSSKLHDVSIHGNTALVTSEEDINIFSFINGSFELNTKIDVGYNNYEGTIAMNDNTIVIGVPVQGESWRGSVYIYERDANGIWDETMKIVPNDIKLAYFGISTAINDNIMVVGAPDDDHWHGGRYGDGSVYVYRQNGSTWVQESKLNIPPGAETYEVYDFGWSVTIKNDKIVVGDRGYGYWKGEGKKGAVFVYEFDSLTKSWNQAGGILENEDCSGGFGKYVHLTEDEELLVFCESDYTLYYYEQNQEEYIVKQTIVFDGWVREIAVDGNAMVLSESREDRPTVIRFFVRRIGVWEEVNRIDYDGPDYYFGWSVALFGNTTLISSEDNVYVIQEYFSNYSNQTSTIPPPSQSTPSTGAPSSLSLQSYYPNWIFTLTFSLSLYVLLAAY